MPESTHAQGVVGSPNDIKGSLRVEDIVAGRAAGVGAEGEDSISLLLVPLAGEGSGVEVAHPVNLGAGTEPESGVDGGGQESGSDSLVSSHILYFVNDK